MQILRLSGGKTLIFDSLDGLKTPSHYQQSHRRREPGSHLASRSAISDRPLHPSELYRPHRRHLDGSLHCELCYDRHLPSESGKWTGCFIGASKAGGNLWRENLEAHDARVPPVLESSVALVHPRWLRCELLLAELTAALSKLSVSFQIGFWSLSHSRGG